jgi:chromosome segregation ATPase
MIESLKKAFQLQIEQRNYDADGEVKQLKENITELNHKTELLEQELNKTTEDRYQKEIELKLVKEQLDVAQSQGSNCLKKLLTCN